MNEAEEDRKTGKPEENINKKGIEKEGICVESNIREKEDSGVEGGGGERCRRDKSKKKKKQKVRLRT